jgi:hypothetical protein
LHLRVLSFLPWLKPRDFQKGIFMNGASHEKQLFTDAALEAVQHGKENEHA